MKLTLGFSPCPNDTFIFDALVNGKMDTQGLEFDVVLEDVQTLNEWAIRGKLDISKISYGVLPLLLENYRVLKAGGALGKGVGPLLISRGDKNISMEMVKDIKVGIPGENTTAHLLFSLAFPDATRKEFMVFSDIEDAVLNNQVDAGVIIHENRFTYHQKGLKKIIDLGTAWEERTQSPIPLGGIVMKRKYALLLQQQVDNLIRRSVQMAFGNYPLLPQYVRQHSQEMDEFVMRQHIDLYVNNFSVELGAEGKKAVSTLLDIYHRVKGTTLNYSDAFVL